MDNFERQKGAIYLEIQGLEDALGLSDSEGQASKWWQTFKNDSIDHPEIIRTVLHELDEREATISELYNAYLFSVSLNIHTNLEFLDHAIETYDGQRPVPFEHFEKLRN